MVLRLRRLPHSFFNRRRSPQAAFARLLGLATVIGPHPYAALVAMGSKG
jgi:hypothetical protein